MSGLPPNLNPQTLLLLQQLLQQNNAPAGVGQGPAFGPPAAGGAPVGGPPAGGGLFGMPGGGRTPNMGRIPSMKKGGKVTKDGVYRLHKGEEVIPAGKTSAKKRHSSQKLMPKPSARHAARASNRPRKK